MKSVYFLILIGIFSTLLSCKQFKADHPQAGLGDEHATDLTAKSILHFVDSIEHNLTLFDKTTSLVYMLGDLSFYVEKYSNNNQPVLLIEHAFDGGISNNLKKYYFKNDSLIFEGVRNQVSNDDGNVFKESRTYLRNNTVFRIEERTASAETEIRSLPFVNIPLSQNLSSDQSHLDNIKTLNDIVNGTNKFEMVFEGITTYPDSRYIMLRNKIQNNYTASILVKEKDAFIDSLLNKPIDFKDQKLKLAWVIKDREAVYVPVASNTSANGLKR